MNNTYQWAMRALIGVAVLLIVIGIYEVVIGQRITNVLEYSLRAPLDSLTRQDISQAVPESESSSDPVSEAAPDTSCCDASPLEGDTSSANTSTQNDTTTGPVIDYTTVYWQDDFNNTASGWEPYFEIKGELPVYQSLYTSQLAASAFGADDVYYTTANATAWNGYDSGSYSFTLPGAPMKQWGENDDDDGGASVTKYLWDFNISQPMPAYPYLVNVNAETTLSTGAMVLLDFAGDVNDVSAGSGILVMIPMQNELGIHSIGEDYNDFRLHVWEFSNNRLWYLGCTPDNDDAFYSSYSAKIDAQFVVDETRLSIAIKGNNSSNYAVSCARALSGNNTATRFLGIGSRIWKLDVPVPYANVLRFHDIVVAPLTDDYMQNTAFVYSSNVAEIHDVSCGMSFSDEPPIVDEGVSVRLDDALLGLCFDRIRWVTDPNPSGRIVNWPEQTEIYGRWQCGISEPFANFEIRPNQDDALIAMAGLEYRLVATSFLSEDAFMIVHNPIVHRSNSETNSYTVHAESQVGDSIGSPSRIAYELSLNPDGSLRTSWMTPPCYRVN
jgi:hypothetical protein